MRWRSICRFCFLTKDRDPAQHWDFVNLDANEALPLENARFDLAVSLLSLHAVNDLPGVLLQIREKLAPDGLFVAALFGGATLFELRESFAAAELETTGGVSPRVYPFADVRDLGGLLQRAGFALPVADVERTTVLYRDFSSLVRDLRAHGETNALAERSRKLLSRENACRGACALCEPSCRSRRPPACHVRDCLSDGLGAA